MISATISPQGLPFRSFSGDLTLSLSFSFFFFLISLGNEIYDIFENQSPSILKGWKARFADCSIITRRELSNRLFL